MSRYRWTILGAGVFAQASYSAIGLGLPAVAPQIQHRYGLSLTQVGVVIAAGSFGSLATLLLWGIATDRVGERAVIALGLAATAAAMVAAGFTTSFGGLVVALAVAGALGAGTNAASGRAVMGWFSAEQRGLALGIRQTAVPLGGAIAAGALPALATHVSVRSSFFGLAGGCCAASVVAAFLLRREPSGELGEIGRPLRDRRVWRLCFGSAFSVMTQISLLGFLVLFLHNHRGLSTAVAAGTLAATQLLGGAARIAAGHWSDRIRASVLPLRRIALALTVSVAITAALVEETTWALVPVLVVATTLGLSWNGLSFTAAAETAGRARAGAAIGLQQSFLSAGSIVAPIAFAAVVHYGSWRLAFAVAAVSPLFGWVVRAPLRER